MRKCLPTVLLAAIAIVGALSVASCTTPSKAVPGATCPTQEVGTEATDSTGVVYVCK